MFGDDLSRSSTPVHAGMRESNMSAAVHGLFDAIADIEQRIYALEVRLSPENHKNDRQSPRDKLHVVLMGPPCSGKSTQASHIQDAFCLCHLSPGNVLQSQLAKKTPAGKEAKEIVKRGGIVTTEIMINMISHELENNKNCKDGCILDGIPRNLSEATRLEQMLQTRHRALSHSIELQVDDKVPESRISGRLVHLTSGRSYHNVFCPPREDMKDDVTGEPLIKRPSDVPEVARARLVEYRTHAPSVGEHYRNAGILAHVDGNKKPSEVFHDIESILNKREEIPEREIRAK